MKRLSSKHLEGRKTPFESTAPLLSALGMPAKSHLALIFQSRAFSCSRIGDRRGTPKNFCDKDFAELSGELSGAICLKALVSLGSALKLFRKFLGAVRAIFWLWDSLFGS